MSYGKELRVPFLDKDVSYFFYNLDNKYKIKNGNLRYLYRKMIKEKFNIKAFEKKDIYLIHKLNGSRATFLNGHIQYFQIKKLFMMVFMIQKNY